MNIFVAKLSRETTSEDLESAFSEYGNVTSAKVIFDKETQTSKCFGFVEMDDDNAGHTAIENLDGAQLQGRTIVVKKANPREERPRRY